MRRTLARLVFISLIAYLIRFGDVTEYAPPLKLIYQVGTAVLLGGWLFSLWRRGRGFPGTPLDAPLFMLMLVAVVSALLSRDVRVSLENVWPLFAHVLLFYCAVDLMRSGYQKWLFEALFVVAGVAVVLTGFELFAWYFGISINHDYQLGWYSIAGLSLPSVLPDVYLPFGHNNLTGMFAVVLLPLIFAWAMTVTSRDLKVGLYLLAAGVFVMLVLTQSRGAYMAFTGMLGFSILITVMHPEIRRSAPAPLRSLMHPFVVIAVALLGVGVAVVILYALIILPDRPNPNDLCRLDLWLSAIRMFKESPLLGVGPGMYNALRFDYINWLHSPTYIVLVHPHNLLLAIVAEGGILALTAVLWAVVRFLRVWWSAWQVAKPFERRRLEAVLVSLVAFSIHNMVDVFYRTSQLVPIMVIAAFVIAKADPAGMPVPLPGMRLRRAVLVALGAALVIVQLLFIPVHRGAFAYLQAMKALQQNDPDTALVEARRAMRLDPWLELYRLEEANILALLAETSADYLDAAIEAHEQALVRTPSWDLGWHNLAALYAQADMLDRAIWAEEHAVVWNNPYFNYRFKLAHYLLIQGETERAVEEFKVALREKPDLASSKYWKDPAYPARQQVLRQVIAETDDLVTRFDLAVYAGEITQAAQMALALPEETLSVEMQQRIDALWPSGMDGPVCERCFYWRRDKDLLALESRLLRLDSFTDAERHALEQEIRRVIAKGDPDATWAWYQLARLKTDDDEAAGFLMQGVQLPLDYRQFNYPQTYGVHGQLVELTQARVPILSPVHYEPWVELGARFAAQGDWRGAQLVYEETLKLDPYDFELQSRVEALSEQASLFDSVSDTYGQVYGAELSG